MPKTEGSPARIVIDWGTTSFRAMLVDEAGAVIEEIENERGIKVLAKGAYEQELRDQIGGWLHTHGPMTIYAMGMITSRNGWVEVPYVACPVSVADLAGKIMRRSLPDGSEVIFLPGITDLARTPYPDVMRGEETQIVGFGLEQNMTLVLPGTHSKWARVAEGSIQGFQTFVTGELFALLAQHSFIAASGDLSGEPDMAAFERGVRTALAGTPQHDALPTLLFSARAGMLAGQLQPGQMRDYVSGLLIGHEFAGAFSCGWCRPGDMVGIVGNDGLNDRYARAAKIAGLLVDDGGEHAGLVGAVKVAAELEALHR
ncbi:2-dehydro-3-deoxygalactonokinase [uncultured Martelella sp.]|uniref:2-dehydro-3-deoxygalactonokinase n=1 Tax=uncultured Martelella sp. TaxID=392331 RepID=UPI0029C8B96F|nr:2-dehydro-3-deoxygalactonokinase [uncultured Martelella sp.]